MAVETLAFNIISMKAVGELSERKIKGIVSLGYQMIANVNNLMVQFMETNTGNTLILAQNQIVYGAIAANVESLLSNPVKAIDCIDSILETLLLDSDYILQTKIERSYDSEGNTFEKANNLIQGKELFVNGAASIGFHIPFSRENFNGDLRLEPIYNNSNKYFMDCVLQTVTPLSHRDQKIHILNSMVNAIRDEFEPLANKLFR